MQKNLNPCCISRLVSAFVNFRSTFVMSLKPKFQAILFCSVLLVGSTLIASVDSAAKATIPGTAIAQIARRLTVEDGGRTEERAKWQWLVSFMEKVGNSSFMKRFTRTKLGRMLAKSSLLQKFAPSLYVRSAHDKATAIRTLFERYGVNAVTSKLFQSRQYLKWSTIVAKAYEESPKAGEAAIFSQLVAHYGGIRLGKLCLEADEDPRTSFAARVYGSQTIRFLFVNDKKTVESLYTDLRLNARKLDLADPDLHLWVTFLTAARKSERVAYRELFLKLLVRVKPDKLDEMLVKAKAAGGGTASLAWGVQLAKWNYEGILAEFLWTKLGLHEQQSKEASQPSHALKVWVAFVWMSGKQPITFDEFVSRINAKLSLDDLAKVLAARTERDYVSRLLLMARRLAELKDSDSAVQVRSAMLKYKSL